MRMMNFIQATIWICIAILFAVFQLSAPWWIVCTMAILLALHSLQDALDD